MSGAAWDVTSQPSVYKLNWTFDPNGWVTTGSITKNGTPSVFCIRTLVMDGPGGIPGTYVALWNGTNPLSIADGGGHVSNFAVTSPGRATFKMTPDSAGNTGFRVDIKQQGTSNTFDINKLTVLVPGGVCGSSPTTLDYFRTCQSVRGGIAGPGAGPGGCNTGETCFDFEQVYWNRFSDPTSQMNTPKVVFHPTFLERIKKFRAFRFMDWMSTNNSPVKTWAGRAQLQSQTQASPKGPAYEYIVALSNLVLADPWINIPHQTDDAYNTAFAQLMKSTLDPRLKVYVEYSNEAWNSIFTQMNYMMAQEKALGLEEPNSSWGRNYFSYRTGQIMDIWKGVFATSSTGPGLVRVLGGRSGAINCKSGTCTPDFWWDDQLLSHSFGPLKGDTYTKVDALAIAPYFGNYMDNPLTGTLVVPSCPAAGCAAGSTLDAATACTGQNTFYPMFKGASVDDVLKEIQTGSGLGGGVAGGALKQSRDGMTAISDMWLQQFNPTNYLKYKNIQMLGYEGGEHLVGISGLENNCPYTNILMNSNRDARMSQVYQQYLTDWKAANGTLFMMFTSVGSYSKWGSWGLLETQNEPRASAPKYDGVLKFMEDPANKCWWSNCARQ